MFHVQDRIARPVEARHHVAIPRQFLDRRAAGSVDELALDHMAQRFGIDDQPDVMCAHKARGLHHTGCAVHAHFRHQRNERVEVTPIGNAAPLNHVLRRIDILARRHALLPAGLFGGNAHGIDVARVFEIAHPEIDRVHPCRN